MSKGKPQKGITLNAFEASQIGNYFVYRVDDAETIAATTGCSLDGTDVHNDPAGITLNNADMPTFTHPNWTLGISGGTSFGSINISDFTFLPYKDNPNRGLTATCS